MQKFKRFKHDWLRRGGEEPVYFVMMDIEKCYDNVNVQLLIELLTQASDNLLAPFFRNVKLYTM